MLSDSKRAF
jgi:KDEL-tailed cysteine endopeptidase